MGHCFSMVLPVEWLLFWRSCPIRALPLELLCQVFDMLGPGDLLQVMATCQHWSRIVSSQRYLKRLKLDIVPFLQHRKGKISSVEHYPVVEIREIEDQATFDAVRRYLFDAEVAQHLEELDMISEADSRLTEELLTGGETLLLPALRRLGIMFKPRNRFNIWTPQLRQFSLEKGDTSFDGTSVLPVLGQIETLALHSEYRENSSLKFSKRPLPKLRSLTMQDTRGQFDEDNFAQYAKNLTYLYLRTDGALADPVEDILLPLATNLVKLHLRVSRWLDYNLLTHLKQLRELSVMEVAPHPDPYEVFLPNLRLLQVKLPSSARFITPNLRALHICVKQSLEPVRSSKQQVEAFFRAVGTQLQVLNIEWRPPAFSWIPEPNGHHAVQLSAILDQVCALTQLQTLRLSHSTAEQSDMVRILTELKQLRRVQLERFDFMIDGTWHPYKLQEEFLMCLRERFVDCFIVERFSRSPIYHP